MAEGGGFFGGDLYLADYVVALIVEVVVFRGHGGVVGGEIDIDVDRVRGFVYDVAGGEGDVEGIVPAAGVTDFDGIFSGLAFHDVRDNTGVAAKDPWTHQ